MTRALQLFISVFPTPAGLHKISSMSGERTTIFLNIIFLGPNLSLGCQYHSDSVPASSLFLSAQVKQLGQ
jgi:hypothetical protein